MTGCIDQNAYYKVHARFAKEQLFQILRVDLV